MSDERDQRNVACALDGNTQRPLVLGTDPRAAAGLDFRAVGHESPNLVDVLVVDDLDVLNTESADPPSGYEPPARTASGTSARPSATGPSPGSSARWSGGTPTLGRIRRPVT